MVVIRVILAIIVIIVVVVVVIIKVIIVTRVILVILVMIVIIAILVIIVNSSSKHGPFYHLSVGPAFGDIATHAHQTRDELVDAQEATRVRIKDVEKLRT